MQNKVNLTKSEQIVMNQIWEIGSMVTVPEMVKILNDKGEER